MRKKIDRRPYVEIAGQQKQQLRMYGGVRTVLIIGCMLVVLSGCKKYLDAKSDQNLSTPDTIEDLQAILDQETINKSASESSIGADEYYLTTDIWQILPTQWMFGYTWNRNATDEAGNYDWTAQYKNVFNANTVLDNLDRIPSENATQDWNRAKGSALFVRANCFYQLAQIYAPPYDVSTAGSDAGICLRLTSDFNKRTTRASVQESYDQIIQDLYTALPLLPPVAQYKTRPGRASVLALLTRVFMTIGNYARAKQTADSSLDLFAELTDFNALDESSLHPLEPLHKEVMYYMQTDNAPAVLPAPYSFVDTTLAASYAVNDLRRMIYLADNGDGTFSYKTISFNGGDLLYNGLSTGEVYLSRAECHARLDNTQAALDDLNTLLRKRWRTGTFVDYTAPSAAIALQLILQERRKELLNRGTRWTDIRRLNKEPAFSITLKRLVNNEVYELPPGDLRYTFLIPQEVINLSGIPQNKR